MRKCGESVAEVIGLLPTPSARPAGCPQLLWVGSAHEHPQLSTQVTQCDSWSVRWAPSINLTFEGTGDYGQRLGRTSRTPRLSELPLASLEPVA